ncbi:MAG: NAD(P)/FAD-dependent oxidoreductase [Candidatus Entotheonellia bacterium]
MSAGEHQRPDMFDITIIGGGPVGLFGLFYAGLRGLKAKLIDSLAELGGQIITLYPEKYIFDVAGYPKILAKDLVKNCVEQGLRFDPAVCLEEKVLGLSYDADRVICLRTDKGEHWTRAVVLTVGVGAFQPKKLQLPDVERLEGHGVYYFVKEKQGFAGKTVLIVGGGDSAVDWALMLKDLAKKVILIHRRDKFRAHEQSVQELMESGVDVKLYYELKAVQGSDQVEGATIFHNKTGEEQEIKVDALVLSLGFLADLGPIKTWGLVIENNAILVNERMETDLPGVYAAGDVVGHPGKLKLITTGQGEAAIAVNFAATYIDPDSKAFPGHSSTMNL